jgi:hypothetical protein
VGPNAKKCVGHSWSFYVLGLPWQLLVNNGII